jgi:nitroreductase
MCAMTDTVSLDPHALDALIRARRTCLRMDPDGSVDPSLVGELCRLAVWAPNHRRTEPWRFAVFTGDGRRRLGDTIAAVMSNAGAAPEKVAKTRTKYVRAPVMLLVGAAVGSTDIETEENRDAVAAGVQNILLGATARGLASFWSSVATPTAPALLDLCGFDHGTHVVAAVYLGHPTGVCPAPERSGPRVTWVT